MAPIYLAGAAVIAAILWHELHPGAVRSAVRAAAAWERDLWRPRPTKPTERDYEFSSSMYARSTELRDLINRPISTCGKPRVESFPIIVRERGEQHYAAEDDRDRSGQCDFASPSARCARRKHHDDEHDYSDQFAREP